MWDTENDGPQKDSRGRLRSLSQTVNDEPSQTVQSDAPRADIGNIIRGFGDFASLRENLDAAEMQWMDISEHTDYKDALGHAIEAESEFMTLPPNVRAIFHHDVAEWLDTAHDKDKRDALVAAGYLRPIVEVVEEVRPAVVEAGGEAKPVETAATPAE